MRSDRPVDDDCLNSAPSEIHFQLWLENVENIVELFESDDLSFNSYTVSDGENISTGESSGDEVDFEEITFDTSDDSSSDELSCDENDAYQDSQHSDETASNDLPNIIELPDSDVPSSPDEGSKLNEPTLTTLLNDVEPLTEEETLLEELPVESPSLGYGNASNLFSDNIELCSDLYDSSSRPIQRISPSDLPCSPESCVSINENSFLPADSCLQNSNENLNCYNHSISPTIFAKDNEGCNDISALNNANSAITVKISREFAIPNSFTDGSYCVESAAESDTIGFKNTIMYMENTAFNTDSYETSLSIESSACNELVSDKLGSNLKRKVGPVEDDDILNKVPKFIASQATSDYEHSSLESYSGVSSSSFEKQSSSSADCPDSKLPTVSDDKLITVDQSVEVTFVIEKPKS